MSILTQVTDKMQEVLNIKANEAAKNSGFIQRQRKFTGSAFVQTLVFGWLHNPDASWTDLAQAARVFDIDVSRQAIVNRMTPEAALTLKATLEAAATACITPLPQKLPLLSKFKGSMCKTALGLRLPTNLTPYQKAPDVERQIKKLPSNFKSVLMC